MPLDPQAQALLDRLAAAGPPPDLAAARAAARDLDALAGPPPPLARVEDRHIRGPAGKIPIRLYAPSGEDNLPVLVYLHGGGFVLGGLDSHDAMCRSLAAAAGCLLVAVDYRLAPEHPFPAGLDDAFAAVAWTAAQAAAIGADPDRLGVGGDSAGGNLAAVVARRARDRGGPPLAVQLLLYPNTDATLGSASWRDLDGVLLSRAGMDRDFDRYLPPEVDRRDPDVSPLFAPDLTGLPPAIVVVAGEDPVRDEAEAYAARLRQAGVPVRLLRYDGTIHAFFQMAGVLDVAGRAMAEVGAALRSALAPAARAPGT